MYFFEQFHLQVRVREQEVDQVQNWLISAKEIMPGISCLPHHWLDLPFRQVPSGQDRDQLSKLQEHHRLIEEIISKTKLRGSLLRP
jgi:hypothetical protein